MSRRDASFSFRGAMALLPVAMCLPLALGGCQKTARDAAIISGEISISKSLAAHVKPGDVLFVFAHPDGQMGPPAAVKRIADVKFPVHYSLSAKDVMLKGMPFAGKMNVKARLSSDGNAMPAPGDLEGASSKDPVAVGTDHVDIQLDQQD